MNQPVTMKPSLARRVAAAALGGVMFFAIYGAANHAAQNAGVTATAFTRADAFIPFVPWTIVPYWSLDVLFVTAFLLQPDRAALRTHTMRVMLAIGIAGALFLAFPLRCAAVRPETSGLWEPWFTALGGVDLPYNQAPSLHIILLLIVWHAHLPRLDRKWRPAAYAWGTLIGVSTLTTRQHGIVDVATGLLVGALIVYGVRPTRWLIRDTPPAPRLAMRYAKLGLLLGSLAAAVAFTSFRLALLLGWSATGAGLVALAYAHGASGIYSKQAGRVHWSAKLVLGPALALQRIVHRLLAARPYPPPTGHVSFGPVRAGAPAHAALLDLTAEHDTAGITCRERAHLPMLDLVTPDTQTLTRAADHIADLASRGPVHVVCALGLERSAMAVAAWQLRHNGASSPSDAMGRVRAANPAALPHRGKLGALADIAARPGPGIAD